MFPNLFPLKHLFGKQPTENLPVVPQMGCGKQSKTYLENSYKGPSNKDFALFGELTLFLDVHQCIHSLQTTPLLEKILKGHLD